MQFVLKELKTNTCAIMKFFSTAVVSIFVSLSTYKVVDAFSPSPKLSSTPRGSRGTKRYDTTTVLEEETKEDESKKYWQNLRETEQI